MCEDRRSSSCDDLCFFDFDFFFRERNSFFEKLMKSSSMRADDSGDDAVCGGFWRRRRRGGLVLWLWLDMNVERVTIRYGLESRLLFNETHDGFNVNANWVWKRIL